MYIYHIVSNSTLNEKPEVREETPKKHVLSFSFFFPSKPSSPNKVPLKTPSLRRRSLSDSLRLASMELEIFNEQDGDALFTMHLVCSSTVDRGGGGGGRPVEGVLFVQ